jgi:CubicO group peptidase (beta-lactamase class C family)
MAHFARFGVRPMRRAVWVVRAVVPVLAIAACRDAPTGPADRTAIDLSEPWPQSTPAALGLDSTELATAVTEASGISRLMSLLVVKNGALVMEKYFRGNRADSLNDVRSVTKSVVSTLVGIAVMRGELTSLDQTLGELLPDLPYQDQRQREVTVWQLLNMSGGFDWEEESANDYNDWVRADDQIRYLLDRFIIHEPGTTFTYNSAAAHLLGVALEAVTGKTLEAYADETLFGPLGVTQRRWEPSSGGHVNGGAGLDLRPRDLARLGQLYLQEGRSGNTQILSRSWTFEATRPHWGWRGSFGPLHALSYGYLWWTESRPGDDIAIAWGWGGEFVLLDPAHDMVVVATSEWRWATDEEADTTEKAVLDVIVNHILGAVR